ncbi:hypothetical protein, partial [Halobacteriovorax sp.]|uniref:hypothetical protein n=1 Tax=Halobacteriovorax sp. TaxID=2020862 RepID=UPI0035650AF6
REEKSWNEEPAYRATEETQQGTLAQSIKDAAARYETNKVEQPQHTQVRSHQDNASTNRAKSIAEKLGFINFDEDELDTPSFLRKDESGSQKNAEF